MWIVAVIIFGSLLVLAWLTWFLCYRGNSRPVILQVWNQCVQVATTAGCLVASKCFAQPFDCIVSRSVPQAITNMRKRVMGEPSRGVITMVNTDIEGYSGESRGF